MNFKSTPMTVKQLLSLGKILEIPGFQREYSWDKKNYKEFLEDMLSNLCIKGDEISYSDYFIGTMVFCRRLRR